MTEHGHAQEAMPSSFDVAVQRLTGLATNPKTPRALSGDLSLVLLEVRQSATLRAENERLRERLAAAERFYVKSADGTCGIEITKAGGKWSVYITHYGIFGPYDGRNGLFESLDAAWTALVAAGWLPAETAEHQPQQGDGR